MAFTDQERDIARQISEQKGTREDFLDVLEQFRSQQTEVQKIDTPEEIDTPEIKNTPEKEDLSGFDL